MVKANELRIGNVTVNPSTGKYSVISSMDISDIENGYKERYGVPLTPEILEKCGFEIPLGSGKVFRLNKFAVIIWPTGVITVEYKNIEIRQIYFLHHLQNFFFWNSDGEELEFKP